MLQRNTKLKGELNMIAYKVVHKKTRYGSNAAGYIEDYGERSFHNTVEQLKLEKFFPVYKKDVVVKQAPKSVGLMAFESLDKARSFRRNYAFDAKIIKVEGTRKRKQAPKIIPGCMCIKYLLKEVGKEHLTFTPEGTIFFAKLKVLE
jgi:hypothetical protein